MQKHSFKIPQFYLGTHNEDYSVFQASVLSWFTFPWFEISESEDGDRFCKAFLERASWLLEVIALLLLYSNLGYHWTPYLQFILPGMGVLVTPAWFMAQRVQVTTTCCLLQPTFHKHFSSHPIYGRKQVRELLFSYCTCKEAEGLNTSSTMPCSGEALKCLSVLCQEVNLGSCCLPIKEYCMPVPVPDRDKRAWSSSSPSFLNIGFKLAAVINKMVLSPLNKI